MLEMRRARKSNKRKAVILQICVKMVMLPFLKDEMILHTIYLALATTISTHPRSTAKSRLPPNQMNIPKEP